MTPLPPVLASSTLLAALERAVEQAEHAMIENEREALRLALTALVEPVKTLLRLSRLHGRV